MALFTRKTELLTPWTDAPLIAANGYCVLPVERSAAEREPNSLTPGSTEQPQGGGWAWGLPAPSTPDGYVVGILAGVLPRRGSRTLADARATWLAVLRVTGAGKRASKDIEAIVGAVPMRVDAVNGDLVVPYRVPAGVTDPRCYGLREGRVSCLSGPVSFLVSGPRFTWKNGDLLTTPRDALPELTRQSACDLMNAIDSTLTKAAA